MLMRLLTVKKLLLTHTKLSKLLVAMSSRTIMPKLAVAAMKSKAVVVVVTKNKAVEVVVMKNKLVVVTKNKAVVVATKSKRMTNKKVVVTQSKEERGEVTKNREVMMKMVDSKNITRSEMDGD